MQKLDNGKQSLNTLLANYRPIGPRHLLAAALMLQAGKDAKEAKEAEKQARIAAASVAA
jgi:hypothetical protein